MQTEGQIENEFFFLLFLISHPPPHGDIRFRGGDLGDTNNDDESFSWLWSRNL